MSTSADRRMRGARNRLVDLLGIGDALPLRDLPVTAAPPIVPYGGGATITVEDAEPGVEYRLRGQAGAPLPSGLTVNATGEGDTLELAMPKIYEPITFTVEAARTSGRTALLLGTAPVAIGLDSSIPAVVAGFDGVPALIDFAAAITVELPHSQEAVAYRLVNRPPKDRAADTDLAALDTDILLSEGGDVRGTGGPITLRSKPLTDDSVVRVRLVKTFPGRRETQVSLLTVPLPVYVRADRNRQVAVAPPVVDYTGTPTLTVGGAQAGVQYALHLAPIPDASFDRAEPPNPASLSVATDGGPVRVSPPRLPLLFEPLPGFTAAGTPKKGAGTDLALPMPALTGDSFAVVAATKQHGTRDASFESSVILASASVALVRPSPSPNLRIEASIAGDKLVQLRALAGEAGVFYAISAANKLLGELYLHQRAAADPSRNKGVDLLTVGVDFVVAADPTSAAPPPVPRLDLDARKLPVELAVTARRAMTGLTKPLAAAKVVIAAPPTITAEFADQKAKVTIADAPATVRHQLLVDGVAAGDPVPGTGKPLVLTTGALRTGAVVELLLLDAADAGTSVERRVAVPPPGS